MTRITAAMKPPVEEDIASRQDLQYITIEYIPHLRVSYGKNKAVRLPL